MESQARTSEFMHCPALLLLPRWVLKLKPGRSGKSPSGKKRKSFRCNLFSFFASKVHSIQREEERLLWNNPIKRRKKKKKGKHQKERKRINFLCACLQGKIQSSLTMLSLLLTEEEVDSQTWKEKELKRRRAFMSEGNGCKNQREKLEAQKTLGRTKLTDVKN